MVLQPFLTIKPVSYSCRSSVDCFNVKQFDFFSVKTESKQLSPSDEKRASLDHMNCSWPTTPDQTEMVEMLLLDMFWCWCTICKLCVQAKTPVPGLRLYVSQKCAQPAFCVCILLYLFIIIANVYFNVQISAKYYPPHCSRVNDLTRISD